MDKNKSRTDMLAAGRKKLQQFRQKKDGKGSSSQGKSLKKSGKSEQHEADIDAASTAGKPTGSLVPEGESASPSHVDSNLGVMDSNSIENSLAPEIDVAAVDSSSVVVTPESCMVEISLARDAVLSPQGGDVPSSVPNEGERMQNTDTEAARAVPSSTVDIPVLDGETKDADISVVTDGSTQSILADTDKRETVTVEMENANRDGRLESPASQEVPDTTLIQVRGDQEADGSGLKHYDKSSKTELAGEGKPNPPELGGSTATLEESVSGLTGVDKVTYEEKLTSNADKVPASTDATNTADGSSSPALLAHEADGISAVSLQGIDHLKDVVASFPNEGRKGMLPPDAGSDGYEEVQADRQNLMLAEVDNQQSMPVGSLMTDSKAQERPLEKDAVHSSTVAVSSDGDGCSVSLSQLKEIVRGLSGDEFRSLLSSRGSGNAELGIDSLVLSECTGHDMFERLKEDLYLTSFTKDIFHLQVSEMSELQMEFDQNHHQLVDEISLLRASLYEAQEKNECMAEEVAHCRSELQAVASSREELENQVHSVKAEAQEFSDRANELQISLERSLGDLSSLSMELADYKGLVASLKVENENLSTKLASVTEDRKKLAEETESCLHENEKLSLELTDCKSLLEALQLEKSNLTAIHALVTEERKKLEEEKESLAGDNQKMCMELTDCRILVESLRDENAKLNGSLASVTEERKKLEEEKESLTGENDKMSTELTECKGLVAALQDEYAELKGSLALIMEQRKKLEEEKESLATENEKMSMELTECKGLVTEERKKLVEEKESLVLEIEKISTELTDCKGLVAALQVENANLNGSLALITEERMKLEEYFVQENKRLSNKLLVFQQKFPTENAAFRQDGGICSPILEKPSSDGPVGVSTRELEEVFDDSSLLSVLKGHFREAENILQDLEKAVEKMHFELTSFNGSVGKVPSPGVSKLIQAFESKVHHDEHETQEKAATEKLSPSDAFMSIKEHTWKLRAQLQQFHLDSENAEEELRKISDVAVGKSKAEYEALKEHSDNLEATNIELGVLYEVIKQHVYGVEARSDELQVLVENYKQRDLSLKAEYHEVGEKLSEHQSRVSELLSQFHDLQRSSDEKILMLEYQVESLQKEASERTLILEREWNSIITQIIKTVEKLDEFTGGVSISAGTETNDGLDANSRVDASVDAAIKVIEDLREKLETAHSDHKKVCSSYKEVNEKFNDLFRKNELASVMLHTLYGDLRKLVIDSAGSMDHEPQMNFQVGALSDPVDYIKYKTVVEQLENFLGERLELKTLNNKLKSELISRTNDVEVLNGRCLDSDAIQKLIENVESVGKLENTETDLDKTPFSHLESLVSSLVKRYKEVVEQVSSSREEFGFMGMELTEQQEKINQLNALKLQHETEILVLKESLRQAEEALAVSLSELQEKVSELEQSEQRISSIREKLSIAVSKGKGLIMQRDSLKQSLAETSKELEKCTQELQLRDARLNELETKLSNMEAGDRVEALESELSYIRNSATALRESFLLKDSVLQRIEEIMEDLDLPEQFHSRDIIEKVDWLARSVTRNSLPVTHWEQKRSVGGSHSDAGFVVTEAWKEDTPPSSSSGDDMRRKYEELQSKFYGLAEQNEMLEQSLMERNYLVQRWEELLDRINMPSHLRSMEPEGRIEWLGTALLDANNDRDSLHQKIENLEDYCGSVTADLEESQKRISELETDLQVVVHEREKLSERMEILTCDHEKILSKVVQFELEKEILQNEMTGLQEKLEERVRIEGRIETIENGIRRLVGLVGDALHDPSAKELASGDSSTECLEVLLRKLIELYLTLSEPKTVPEDTFAEHRTEEADASLDKSGNRDVVISGDSDTAHLEKDLEDALANLMHVKEERDAYMEKQQSFICEVAALDKKRMELQELLAQEEQKSASLREKLNVAVRKGKLVVQQRDSLKQTLEQMTNELEHLKSEISHRENSLVGYEQKIKDLSTYPEMVEALESEKLFLRNRLTEAERLLQERENILNVITNALIGIDVGGEVTNCDPVEKLEQIGKQFHVLHAALASSEQKLKKSRRAAELLLAELTEVQERNDVLQEELEKAASELSEISKERDVAEAAKVDALSHLDRKDFLDIDSLLADVFSKDLEFVLNLEAYIQSCLKQGDTSDVVSMPITSAYGGYASSNSVDKENILFMDSWPALKTPDHVEDTVIVELCSSIGITLQELMSNVGSLREKLHKHPKVFHDKARNVFEVMNILCGELTSQKNSVEALKRDIARLESIETEKDLDNVVLRRNIVLLYEAAANSIMEIENRKAALVGSNLVAGDLEMTLNPATIGEAGLPFGGQNHLSSEEFIKAIADKLSSTVKDFAMMRTEFEDGNLKEMKITIAKMQRELQEKDIQRDRICSELVGQIKEAEAAARRYSQDVQSAETRIFDMEQQVQAVKEERGLLEERLKELRDEQATFLESKDRVLAAKDQEIEALMQALDEEENQIEELKKNLVDFEKVVQQKNLDLENLEVSRGKIAKRLSVTVSKFDELHLMSETLLSEVEKLELQLQDRDAEISFLRQEVTRCTNEVLASSQMNNKRDLNEIQELISWLDSLISEVGVQDVHLEKESNQAHEYKEILQKKISGIISEFEDLRAVAQSQDTSLQVERNRVEELTRKEELLRNSLREKEAHINMLEGVGDSGRATSVTSEILEVEPVINKWAAPGPSTTSQVRSLRKVNNNDQVAIAIDMEPGSASGRLEDEDDEKVHGFKSLATSRIVPRCARPVTDMIDGLWVSCDRALMRQPALRLSIIVYWAVLHTLVASFVF
ncbi:hypothetical protein AB3S75_018663 [Citrus x aurantiifolia]